MTSITQQHHDPSTSAGPHIDALLVPPQLPPFLASAFDLKPIRGLPSTEEVKLVHAAIRAVNSLLQTPELRDSDIPMELSQHLFDIQMACYREKHPVGIFPNDIVYTPPTLPTHIPIKLDPVVGPPSDDELRSAHAALRISDSFANVASLFNEDFSIQLSQHVFDLQLARHVQLSRARPPVAPPVLQNGSFTCLVVPDSSVTDSPDETRDARRDARQELPSQEGSMTRVGLDNAGVPQRSGKTVTQRLEEKNGLQKTNRLLIDIGETLKYVGRVLVGTQNSLARGFNSSFSGTNGFSLGAHSLINEKGETPQMYGLPTLQDRNCASGSIAPWDLSVNVLARYLQFYDIGPEMIDDSGELTIKPDMEEEAQRVLRRRVYANEC